MRMKRKIENGERETMKTVRGTLLILSLIVGMSFSAFADQNTSKAEAAKRRAEVRKREAKADRARAAAQRAESQNPDSSGEATAESGSASPSGTGTGQNPEGCKTCGGVSDRSVNTN